MIQQNAWVHKIIQRNNWNTIEFSIPTLLIKETGLKIHSFYFIAYMKSLYSMEAFKISECNYLVKFAATCKLSQRNISPDCINKLNLKIPCLDIRYQDTEKN